MKRQNMTAALLALGLACGATSAVTGEASAQDEQSAPKERSDFADRAYQTRVGTQPTALDPDLANEPCDGGNAARETIAMHLAEQLEEEGADNLVRGNMVERKVQLKQPCP